jgi:ubiquinone/menaquinone biosynthesis C-methylase UbiE
MTHEEAVAFLEKGVKRESGLWLDMGAGSGIFTLALAELLPFESKIYAVDKNKNVLNISSANPSVEILPVQVNFNNLPDFPELDGILMANALHYIKAPIPFLQNLLKSLRSGGSFILIEYDTERGNPWVPYPISFKKWQNISEAVGLSIPKLFNERISRFGQGTMYAAISYFEV